MVAIALLLFFFAGIGLFATRFRGRAHALLIAGIAVMLAYELVHLYGM